MGMVVHCEEIGYVCDGVFRGETEEELFEKLTEHFRSVHSIQEIPAEMKEKIRSAMQRE